MGNFSPIHKIIDAALNLDLANPNFAISEKEALLRESAIMLGCLDYYRTFPMRVVYLTTYNSMGNGNTSFNWSGLTAAKQRDGNMYIPFEDFYTQARPKVPERMLSHVHFLGILRVERPAWGNWANPSMWNTAMFGFPISGQYAYDIMDTLTSNTYDELSTGQPVYTINRMENCVEVLSPWGLGQLSFYAALGFDSPEFVEMSKVDFLCKFISLRFIESIIQARSGIKLDADFEVSTDALKDRLAKLREEVDSIKNHSVLHTAQWT